jgi:hypothetical protein
VLITGKRNRYSSIQFSDLFHILENHQWNSNEVRK